MNHAKESIGQFLSSSVSQFRLRGLSMPELRKDPIVGRWVIIATDRAKRPDAPKVEPLPVGAAYCPFCEGHEDKTPGNLGVPGPQQQTQ